MKQTSVVPARDFMEEFGRNKIIVANRLWHLEGPAKHADDLRCRNLYRAACGLPLIQAGVQIEIGIPLQLYYKGGNA